MSRTMKTLVKRLVKARDTGVRGFVSHHLQSQGRLLGYGSLDRVVRRAAVRALVREWIA